MNSKQNSEGKYIIKRVFSHALTNHSTVQIETTNMLLKVNGPLIREVTPFHAFLESTMANAKKIVMDQVLID